MDLSTKITWMKKRVGSWWEKRPELWVFVLIILIGFLYRRPAGRW